MTDGSAPSVTAARSVADTPAETDVRRRRAGLQRLVAMLAVGVLPFFVAPGMIQPDTKVDLLLSPGRYLGRALWAWNDHTGVGELQNQAYGYLWPMGPFYWLGEVVGLDAWVIQRAWWALILVVALLGTERLARRVAGLGTGTALLAGAVYALSPRVLTVLSEISVEVWPYALLPWLVLAAERAVREGATASDRRRAAVTTGLLAACLGGVNATVSLVALVPAAGWILLAPRGRLTGRALAWWSLGALLGSAWWLGPLLVLGRYSYPFLDFIEVASTTTAVASLPNVLRGAQHWVAYILTAGDHPTWQTGWVLAQSVLAIIGTMAVAGLGLAGLIRARRDGPGEPASAERRHLTRWALTGVLLGVLVMAVGREGSGSGPLAGPVQDLLDGPLAALRNVHKADPLVRLPVALGVGLLVAGVAGRRGRVAKGGPAAPGGWTGRRFAVGVRLTTGRLLVAGTAVALVAATLPLWQGRGGDAWAYDEVPAEWATTAETVDRAAQREGGATLLLPGARTADYTWGRTVDEPLAALAESPVLGRGSAPLGHPGATRVLDGIDLLASAGVGSPRLADQLERLGVRRVVVRWGISPDVGTLDPDAAAATLDASPGIERTDATGEGEHRVVVWSVAAPDADADDAASITVAATLYPVATAQRVAGAPEVWTELAGTGLLTPEQAMLLTGDVAADDPVADGLGGDGSDAAAITTDSLRWQALASGLPPQDGRSPTLPADDPRPVEVGTRDLPPGGESTGRTTRVAAGTDDDGPVLALPSGDGPVLITRDPRAAADPSLGEEGADLRRTATPPTGALDVRAWARPRPSLAAEDLLDGPWSLRGSTRAAPDRPAHERLQHRPGAAVDGDPATRWEPAPDEAAPTLEIDLGEQRRVSTISLDRAVGPVRVQSDRGTWVRGSAARLQIPEQQTSTLRLTFVRGGDSWRAPEVSLEGLPGSGDEGRDDQSSDEVTVELGCGQAGSVRIGQERIGLALSASRDDLLSGRPVPLRSCGQATHDGGRTDVVTTATDVLLPEQVRVTSTEDVGEASADGPSTASSASAAPARGVTSAEREHPGRWRIDVEPGEAGYLTLAQGANAGWQARTADGRRLDPVTVDGWRQGFRLPAGGAEQVTVDFAPNGDHRTALLVGGLLVALLLLWAAGERLARARRPSAPAVPRADGTATTRGDPPGTATQVRCMTAGRLPTGLTALVLGGLVAGPLGALLAPLGALVPSRARPLAVLGTLLLSALAVAALGVAERYSAGAWVGQGLGAVTVGLLLAALLRPGGPRR